MEYKEMHASIRTMVDELARTAPGEDWSDIRHLLEHGQDDEAMDVLIATIVRGNIAVTTSQRETLRDLMAEFEFDDDSRHLYRYLSDTEMLARMNVADEPEQ